MTGVMPAGEVEALRRQVDELESELAVTNQEMLALTLELDERVAERTRDLRIAHDELQRSNSELLQLTLEFEDRVAQRTRELDEANARLRAEVAHREEVERETRRLNAELERRIAERTATLRELQRSNAELAQFAHVAAHDLQEPLRAISTFTALIGDRYRGRLDDDADKYIGFIVDGSQRLVRMINDLLRFSRINTVGTTPRPTDAAAPLREALSSLRDRIAESGATIACDPLPQVVADARQVAQVFQNLIGNAIRFRGDDPPRIHVGAVESEDEWVFAVSDNGIGIDPKHHDRVFVIFQQLAGKHSEGTGIGLAICKRIVERHGGRIWFEPGEPCGSVFRFALPKRTPGSVAGSDSDGAARDRDGETADRA
jgi:signal transduction histidine kinase